MPGKQRKEQKRPFFSVIIPTLNEEKFLPKLLRALESQQFCDYETIVVDGMSDDNTVNLAKSFKKKLSRLSIVASKKRNLAHQRHLGAEKAIGKYFVFFDADVSFNPTFLQKIHKQILKTNIKFITTWLNPDRLHKAGQMIAAMYNVSIELENFIGKPYVQGGNMIIDRDAYFQIGGYDETLILSEDQEFALRANKKGFILTILKSPKVTLSFRRYRSEGFFSVIRRQVHANFHTILRGKITKQLIEYEMGGHVHEGIKFAAKKKL